jgi:uncharacterized phage-associated protein
MQAPPLPSGPGTQQPPRRAYPAFALANFFLAQTRRAAGGTGRSLDAVELSLFVYVAHGVSLALYGAPLLEEDVLATENGLVVPPLFHALRGVPASKPFSVYDPERGRYGVADPPPRADAGAQDVLRAVWERYGRSSAEGMCEDASGAWSEVVRAPGFQPGSPIPDALTEVHFAGLMAEALA